MKQIGTAVMNQADDQIVEVCEKAASPWHRAVRAGRQAVCVLFCLAVLSLVDHRAAAATTALAIADFDSAGLGVATGDPAFGLADLLAVELQQRGVTLWERQQMRLVLGERRLAATGLIQLRKSEGSELPNLNYLVTGRVQIQTNEQFQLETALVDARSGQNAASFSSQGKYPDELPMSLGGLADQMTTWLKSAAPASIRDIPRATRSVRTPEVNLLFYKGLEYCLAGQPEMGVTWLIDAERLAPHFLAARVWTLRAFEMLGLPHFITAAQARLREAPGGAVLLNRLAESPLWNSNLVSIVVLADARIGAAGREFQATLKTAMAQQTNLFVTDPANFRALAAEMDLQLTEQSSRDLELASALWSAVDAVLMLSPSATDQGQVQVELREARSGNSWLRRDVSRDAAAVQSLVRDLAEAIKARHPAGALASSAPNSARLSPTRPIQVSNADRAEFAAWLRFLTENPGDRAALERLALFSRWLNARYDGAYQRAVADWIEAATPANDPAGAHWLSTALWHRRYYDAKPAPLPAAAALLLARYPNSPEAKYARSAMAEELLGQKKYGEAAALLLQLAAELPGLTNRVQIGPDYWANFYFFTAAALYESGDPVRARSFLERAARVLAENPNLRFNRYALGVWVNHFPNTHPLFGPESNLRTAVMQWQERINGNRTNAPAQEILLRQLEDAIDVAYNSPDLESKFRYLELLVEFQQKQPELFRGRITSYDPRQPWRIVRIWRGNTGGYLSLFSRLILETPGVIMYAAAACDSQEQLAQLRSIACKLATPLDAPLAARFLAAAGESELALQKVQQAQAQPTPFEPQPDLEFWRGQEIVELRRLRIQLLQTLHRTTEAATYARSLIPRDTRRPPMDVCIDAAEAFVAAKRPDTAAALFAELVRATGEAEVRDEYLATLRICWADYELAARNLYNASEILRTVATAAEGRNWGGYLRGGYELTHEAAVSRLAKIRAQSQIGFSEKSDDWAPTRRSFAMGPDPANGESPELNQDLGQLLRGGDLGGGRRYSSSQGAAFAKKHGNNAVPAILRAALRNDEAAQAIVWTRVLDQVAIAADAPAVLEAFKHCPRLALSAFRLDRTNAANILRERFSIYATGGNIPPELRQVLAQHGLIDQYPVLIANLKTKDLDGNTAIIAHELDGMLRTKSTPALLESYRDALAVVLERQMLSEYRYRLAELGEIALRWGWPEGLEALLHGADPSAGDILPRLRKYLDLPPGDTEALAWAESNLGRWCWNAARGKFVIAEASVKN